MSARRRWLCQALSIAVLMAGTLMSTTAHSQEPRACAAESRVEQFIGLQLCIPAGNDRYLFRQGHLNLYWRGDDPIGIPSEADKAAGDITTVVAPYASDKDGDGLARAIISSVLDAAGDHGADVLIQGEVRRYQFQGRDGALRGTHTTTDGKILLIFLRPERDMEPPHLVLCSELATHDIYACLAFTRIAGRPLTTFVVGGDSDRVFLLSEEVVSDLRSFAIQAAP
jgi:hypothetical protein